MTSEEVLPEGYMRDGRGNLVLRANIKEIDLLRDSLVNSLIAKARPQSKTLHDFKIDCLSEIEAFLDLSAMEYGKKRGGKKGNVTLYNYDQSKRIELQIAERITWNEQLGTAKALIDECIKEWGADAHPMLMALINDAFSVDKTGQVSTARVLGLRRHKSDHPIWMQAMTAISNAFDTAMSKKLVRFYERLENSDTFVSIPLDIAGA